MEVKEKEKKEALSVDNAINEGVDKAEEFFLKNKKKIFNIGGAVLGVIILYVGYKVFYLKPLEEEAQSQIFTAQKYFEKDSVDQALNGSGNYKGMLELADEYGSTPTGNLAKYYAGMCYLKKGEFDNAINYLEDFTTKDEVIAPLAEGAIGDANVELGNYDKAVKHFIKAAKMSKNKFTCPIFYKKAALVYEELKEYSKAAELYELIKKDFKDTPEGQEMDKYIGRARAMENNS